MKPVAVIQHCGHVRPGYFASFLQGRSIPLQLVALDQGEALPTDIEAFSGLCLLGGPMSVNDALPWIEAELSLIRAAFARDIPVIGHCLGGQLMSRALHRPVTQNPVKEIGWGRVWATDAPEARAWLGPHTAFDVYQWHGETFALPPAAVRILEGAVCPEQAWVMGPHLAMQFHIEITEALIVEWNREWRDALGAAECVPPSVQTPAAQWAQLPQALPRMREVAGQLYGHWVRNLHS